MSTVKFTGAALAGMAAILIGAAGCRYDDSPRHRDVAVSPYQDVGMKIEPSRDRAIVGEVVTFTARTENLLGRDAQIRWSAPAGELRTEQDGRVARVIFDEPGTYSVSAQLFVEGMEIRRDTKTVTVRPLP
jgi:plastocyanin